MAASVWGLLVLWPEAAGTLPVLMRATMISLCGGIVHIAAQLLAWHMAGSPPGAEAQFLGTVRATLGRFTAPSSRRAQTAG